MDLNDYIAEFYVKGGVSQDKINKHNQLIEEFNQLFTNEKLQHLTYHEYVMGKDNKDSYSYWLEIKTHIIGSIKGGNVSKHQIWFDKSRQKMDWTQSFEKGDTTPIDKMRQLLSYLKNNGEYLSYKEIDELPGSNTLKFKTLYLYHPQNYLPIFSEMMYDYYLKQIGYNPMKYKTLSIKQKVILDWKNSEDILAEMSNYEFVHFLFYLFGIPKRKDRGTEIQIEGGRLTENSTTTLNKNYKVVENPHFHNYTRENKKRMINKPVKLNYTELNEKRSINGSKGEKIVMQYELDRLKKSGYLDGIEQVSIYDDSKGYDIKSYEENGKERYIEVKTSTSTNIVDIFISQNEVEFGRKHFNYWIYVVTDINNEQPVIYPLENPLIKDSNIKLNPISYKATISV